MIKVAITGPECTGKSELSVALQAALPNAVLVPEVARAYLESKGMGYQYSLEDVEAIGELQHLAIQGALNNECSWVICDTEMLVVKIWMEVVFGEATEIVNSRFAEQQFDVIFLCFPDLPWVEDPLRENPNDREFLFSLYEKALTDAGVNYCIVRGTERLNLALSYLKTFR